MRTIWNGICAVHHFFMLMFLGGLLLLGYYICPFIPFSRYPVGWMINLLLKYSRWLEYGNNHS